MPERYILTSRSFSLGDPETAILHVAAVLDPVSEQAQRWSGLLKVCEKSKHSL